MELLFLYWLSVLPPIFLMYYIIKMDRNEPEPMGLILITILLGGLSTIPARLIEGFFFNIFMPHFKVGMPNIDFATAARASFTIIGPVEEISKLSVVLIFIWRNSNFNEENDGIVYTGAAAMGFAMVENLQYVMGSNMAVGIARAITAIPLHIFTAVIMGYCTGVAKFAIKPSRRRIMVLAGLFAAIIIHAGYDTFALSGTAAVLLVVPLVIFLVIFGVVFLNKGRQLSLKRWGSLMAADREGEPTPVGPIAGSPASSSRGLWKAVISRTLFGVCGIFWFLIVFAIIAGAPGTQQPLELVLGSLVITFFPLLIALLLEISYWHGRRRIASAG